MADLAGSNTRTEKGIRRKQLLVEKQRRWSLLQLPCRIHRVQACKKKMMHVVSRDISSLVALSLQQGQPGAMHAFQKLVGHCLVRKLKRRIAGGRPLPKDSASAKYNQAVFDVAFEPRHSRHSRTKGLAPDSVALQKRRLVCESFFAGSDLRKRRWSHACQGCCSSLKDCKRRIRQELAKALAPAQVPTFHRAKWTGTQSSANEVTLLHQVLRLGEMVVPKFVQARLDKAKTLRELAAQGSTEEETSGEESVGSEASAGNGHEDFQAYNSEAERAVEREVGSAAEYWQVRNKRERKQIDVWFKTDAGGGVAKCSRVFSPVNKSTLR